MRLFRLFFVVLSVFLMTRCGGDSNPVTPSSTAPTITSVSPNTLSRGERVVTLDIGGANLIGVSSVSLGPEILIHVWRSISPSKLEVDISVGRDASAGPRTISVNAQGGSATSAPLFTVQANVVPVADFTVTPKSGNENDTFEFDGSASTDDGRITGYLWDFGDGKPVATSKIVTRKFAAGTYQVALTVTDNNGTSSTRKRDLNVERVTETQCTQFSANRGLLYGTVIAVEAGNNAIVKLDRPNSTCNNSFYVCGDMRNAEVDLGFYGIISAMTYLGNNTFRVKNDCPFAWPPPKNSRVFLFYKHCSNNFCK